MNDSDILQFFISISIIISWCLNYYKQYMNLNNGSVGEVVSMLPPTSFLVWIWTLDQKYVNLLKSILVTSYILLSFFSSLFLGVLLFTSEIIASQSGENQFVFAATADTISALILALTISSLIGAFSGGFHSIIRAGVQSIDDSSNYWNFQRIATQVVVLFSLVISAFLTLTFLSIFNIENNFNTLSGIFGFVWILVISALFTLYNKTLTIFGIFWNIILKINNIIYHRCNK